MGYDTDTGSDTDGLESTPFGIGDDTTEDRNDVGEELEHGIDSGSLDGSLAEGTGSLVCTSRTRGDGTGSVTSNRQRTSDEVLEDVLRPVV